MQSPHEAATSYQDAAVCYKKTNTQQAVLLYKEVVSIHIDLGRFTSAAKVQKEIGELYEAESDMEKAIEGFQTAADYYQAEEAHSSANQMLLKVAGLASSSKDYKRAIEIYEQVGRTTPNPTPTPPNPTAMTTSGRSRPMSRWPPP